MINQIRNQIFINQPNSYSQFATLNTSTKSSNSGVSKSTFLTPLKHDVFFGHKYTPLVSIFKKIEAGTLKNGDLSAAYKKKLLHKKDILEIAIKFPDKIPPNDFIFFAKHKIPLTKFDNKAILKLRKSAVTKKVVTETDKSYHAQKSLVLSKEYLILDNAPKEKKMTLIIGLAGSGKSTIAEKFYKDTHYISDNDILRRDFIARTSQKLQSLYNVCWDLLHNEIIPHALNQGSNIVVQTTRIGSDVDKVLMSAKAKGFHIEVVVADVDKETAMFRVVKRFKETGRFLDPFLVATRAPYMKSVVKHLKNSDLVDKMEIINCR